MRQVWLVVASIACMATLPACGQAPVASATTSPATAATTPAATYRIMGTILSARDGHTLRHATVRIYPSGRPVDAQTVTSDDSGQFEFKDVAAGTFVLEGSATGFVTSNYEQHGNFNTGIVTGAGVNTESLVLTLEPQGAISLRLTDEAGEPAEAAQVQLFRKSADPGEAKPLMVQAGSTNDQGHWESRSLQPGAFYVVVQGRPWYAVHPNHTANGQQPPFGFVDSIQPELDVAYPLLYYPGATDESGATPVDVRGGDTVELSMQLRPEPAFTITLPLPPPPPSPQVTQAEIAQGMRARAFPQVMTTVFGQPHFVQTEQFQDQGHMVISGLAPGQYELRTPPSGPAGNEGGSATAVRITNQSLTAEAPGDSQVAHVKVAVKSVDGSRVSRPTQVLVMRNGEVYRRETVDLAGAVSFDIDPGDYTLDIQGGSRSLQVRQVLADEKPMPGNRVHLAAAQDASYIVNVAPGNHTVSGVVQRDGKPASGVFVLMIPTADLGDPHTFYRDQSDLDGSFRMIGIAAGDYTLFAVQHGWDLDWHKKATYDHYLEHATALHVDNSTQTAVKLGEPVQAQPR